MELGYSQEGSLCVSLVADGAASVSLEQRQ